MLAPPPDGGGVAAVYASRLCVICRAATYSRKLIPHQILLVCQLLNLALYLLLLPPQGLLPDPLDLQLDLTQAAATGTPLARRPHQPPLRVILFVAFLWEICRVGCGPSRQSVLLQGKPPKCLIVIITHVEQLVGWDPLMLVPSTLRIARWVVLICQ
jgi:hypothetical protein